MQLSHMVFVTLESLNFKVMKPKIPILKENYGRLTPISEPYRAHRKREGYIVGYWKVKARCVCNTEVDVNVYDLKRGASTSCGCFHRQQAGNASRRHGMADRKNRHPLYVVWANMKQRCYDVNSSTNTYWRGMNVSVCDEWRNDFQAFYDWAIVNGWQIGLTIDRFPDPNGNYEPSNCRFATQKENNRNKRKLKLNKEKVFEIKNLYGTGNYTMKKLAEIFSVTISSISYATKDKIWAD